MPELQRDLPKGPEPHQRLVRVPESNQRVHQEREPEHQTGRRKVPARAPQTDWCRPVWHQRPEREFQRPKAPEHQRLVPVPDCQRRALEWERQRREPEMVLQTHQTPVLGRELQKHPLRVLGHRRDHR